MSSSTSHGIGWFPTAVFQMMPSAASLSGFCLSGTRQHRLGLLWDSSICLTDNLAVTSYNRAGKAFGEGTSKDFVLTVISKEYRITNCS